jgi:soluble lytic murein transglycosylase-like protein
LLNMSGCNALRPTAIAVGTLALLALAAPARAQIYSWHDANGTLVVSNHPQPTAGTPIPLYAVPKAERVLATRSVAPRRSATYDDLIVQHARENDVRPDLVRAVVQVESGFNPYARSPKGALGLMQLMPATIRQYGVHNPFDPADNVRAGVAYLRNLLDRYDDNETLALAAYNAGPDAVDSHGHAVPPYAETRKYVAQVGRLASRPLAERRSSRIYKITEIIDGRAVVRYTDTKPRTGEFEVVGSR